MTPSRLLKVLEYDKITALLAERASGAAAAAAAAQLLPVTDTYEIAARQDETAEAVRVIMRKGSLPLGEYGDISRDAVYADKGGVLTMNGLLGVAKHLNMVRVAVSFVRSDIAAEDIPLITSIASVMTTDTHLEDRIKTSILSENEMADTASPELKRIRREKARMGDTVKAHLNKLITSSAYKDILQDQLVTIRDGRYVVPVRQEHRQKVAGLVHDQSKGGATVFIEPQAVVDLNNKLRELELAEVREIERILAELSAQVGSRSAALLANQEMIVRLDLIFAKGTLACDMDAARPAVGEGDILEIEAGRHPLIDAKKVVPVSLSIGKGYRTLIITGPNTGGKTVTLKTVGLFILMAQAGLHVPAAKARIPQVREVFADIGDEQSIEQSLSTFSSHMKNIVAIVKNAGFGSFVFLDELGAGTDPTEGAALAIAILEALDEKGAMILATTHYTELKKYALASERAMNASMEFNVETLSPTYRLRIGTPGRSNAFEISRKLGLPDNVVAKAEASMDGESVRFDEVIESVETDRLIAERERAEAESLRAELERERRELAQKRADFDTRREDMLAKARLKAENSIDEAREYAEVVREELKALLADAEDFAAGVGNVSDANDAGAPTRGDFFRKLDESRKLLKDVSDDIALSGNRKKRRETGARGSDPGGAERPLSAAEIHVGDNVRIDDLDQVAEVLLLPDADGNVQIRAGILRMTVPVSSLSRATKSKASGSGSRGKQAYYGGGAGESNSLVRGKVSNVSSSVNVIGSALDDAKLTVEKYLDDASLAGLTEVTVIHGLGTGKLRDGLRTMLRRHRLVKNIRPGGQGEGGDGATVVGLK